MFSRSSSGIVYHFLKTFVVDFGSSDHPEDVYVNDPWFPCSFSDFGCCVSETSGYLL